MIDTNHIKLQISMELAAKNKLAKAPNLIMMIGLPGSGKTTRAETFATEQNYIIHSSDKLREELYNDENDQNHNQQLFVELHKRIKEDLRSGKNVIYDATNLTKKRRRAFLSELKSIRCTKTAWCIMTPYNDCIRLNESRKRRVPESVIKDMYLRWQPPEYGEGFDAIIATTNLCFEFIGDYQICNMVEEAYKFNQENEHHKLTLGEHLYESCKHIQLLGGGYLLELAALLHDEGKRFTKSNINSKGFDDGNCHYYQHHCVGAYNSWFYLCNEPVTQDDMVYIANLIYYHMHPYTSWKQSEKAMLRDKAIMGEKMFRDVMLLHEADLEAH